MDTTKTAAEYRAELKEALDRKDFAGAGGVVEELHLALGRGRVLTAREGAEFLKLLQKKRQFHLMDALSSQILAGEVSGPGLDEVIRRRGQALIDRGRLDEALPLLESLARDPLTSEQEKAEAGGLIGRVWKQRYTNAAKAGLGDFRDLEAAIASYSLVYYQNPAKYTWQGVNVVSLAKRAAHDGYRGYLENGVLGALEIANQILAAVADSKQVWDIATAAEALLAKGEYAAAEERIAEYAAMKDADSFELSSTYRQYIEVLQLDREPRAQGILRILRYEILMRRGGGHLASMLDGPAGWSEGAVAPFLMRVGRWDWTGEGIDGLRVTSRMGSILSCSGTQSTILQLIEDRDVVSIEGSRPGGGPETAHSLVYTRVVENGVRRLAETGDQALVAIIDAGIDVLHQAFLDGAGQSRIVKIWDQRDNSGPRGDCPYGTLHDTADIARYVRDQTVPPGLGRDSLKHGTHVASIAAGRASGDFKGGVAPDAKIVVVISKTEAEIGMPNAVGYSTSHHDALAFIDKSATELGLPVVVNVSQGQNAGAHDGTSLLETSFDGFAGGGRTRGRIVVKSAGNERLTKGHAKVTIQTGGFEDLKWTTSQGSTYQHAIELWFGSARIFRVTLRDPMGEQAPTLSLEQKRVSGKFPSGTSYEMSYQRYHDDNGDSRILISLAPTTAAPIPDGTWTLDIESPTGGEMHAWVERTERRKLEFANHQDEEMTLSIPGTAATVIAVGAVENGRARLGDFSSYGPTRDGREKPDVAAPGVGINAAAAGTSSGAREESGTSMAAPHVTGALALLLSRDKKAGRQPVNAAIAVKLLRYYTLNNGLNYERGQGYGVVDIGKLLELGGLD